MNNTSFINKKRAISADCTQFWNNVPAHLRYDMHTENEAWANQQPSTTVRIIAHYLDYLHTHFQVQRLLHQQTQQALPALLEVSLKLLTTALVSIKPNNRAYQSIRHFPTVMLFFCFPAAGVLALELKRRTLESIALPSCVSRADIIRNLSVLTSCLEWIVVPGDGHHKLCTELNKILARILDEVLNHKPVEKEARRNAEAGPDSAGDLLAVPIMPDYSMATEAEDFLNWLDTATWSNPGNMV